MSRTAACLCIAATVALAQPTALPTAPPTIPPTTTTPAVATTAHIHFLLDRSGSMHAIASDVIGGYNAYVAEQQALENSTTGMKMTLVQFDSQDPHEILFSGEALADVPLLTERSFRPRAQTPLFDAIGKLIAHAERARASDELPPVVVVFSDGHENSSREHSRATVFELIKQKQAAGWTFVFMGANQDSYASGGGLGISADNTQNFAFDSEGSRAAWHSLSSASSSYRQKMEAAQASAAVSTATSSGVISIRSANAGASGVSGRLVFSSARASGFFEESGKSAEEDYLMRKAARGRGGKKANEF